MLEMIKDIGRITCWLFLAILIGCKGHKNSSIDELPIHPLDSNTSKTIRLYFDKEQNEDQKLKKIKLNSSHLIYSHYLLRAFNPYWSEDARVNKLADEALSLLSKAKEFGLNSRDYEYSEIYNLANAIAQSNKNRNNGEMLAAFDLKLTNSMLLFISHLHNGRINPNTLKVIKSLHRSKIDLFAVLKGAMEAENFTTTLLKCQPESKAYHLMQQALVSYLKTDHKEVYVPIPARKRDSTARYYAAAKMLVSKGYLLPFSDTLPQKVKMEGIAMALKRFQHFHGLIEDGRVGPGTIYALTVPQCHRYQQMVINLERWRWEPAYESDYLFINIPAFTLSIMHEDKVLLKHKVIVGLPENPTPQMSNKIEYFIVYPEWSIPFSISSKEILPILKENPSYLDEKNYVLLNKENKEIDPYSINWEEVTEANFNYYIRQASGDDNALGYVKFIFPNSHSVYLHDTPYRTLFEKEVRAFSHGCVRVENPLLLADYLLIRDTSKLSLENLKVYIDKKTKKHIRLKHPMPVHIKYFTSMATSEGVFFYNDIYNRDERIINAFFD